MFKFKCASCDEWHEGMPTFGADAPLYYYSVPPEEREKRCKLTSDICVVDDEFFFIRGCIEIPVAQADGTFEWGVWVSLKREHFLEYLNKVESPDRVLLGPYFGWLSADFLVYPDSENLKTYMHPRKPGLRPLIELEPTDHPLAVEQRNGISQERLGEIYSTYMDR